MMLFLFLTSIVLSIVSAGVMSYLAMNIEITFWVGPIISLLIILLSKCVFGKRISQDCFVMLLAAGSLGEMIGLAIGFSWPTLYFLHKKVFLSWMSSPSAFLTMIAMLVFAAGGLAAIITFKLWPYLKSSPFPTVRVFYNMIFRLKEADRQRVAKGFLLSGAWSFLVLIFKASISSFWLLQIHTVPTLLSMGFVASRLVTKPLLLGAATRVFVLLLFNNHFFIYVKPEDFILTFSLGMLLAVVCRSFFILFEKLYFLIREQNWLASFAKLNRHFYKKRNWLFSLVPILFSFFILHNWHMSFLQQCYMFTAITIACAILASVFAEMGVLDLPSFGSFVVIPLGYLFYVSAEVQLIAFVFATACLGFVIVLLFLWKLADLADIPLLRVARYQAVGFFSAAVSIGLIIWWYAKQFNFTSESLFSSQALLQEKFITLQHYDINILILGFLFAIALYFINSEMSLIITGCMMNFSIVGWVILSGYLASYVKNREKYYPFCFGVYASHAIWLCAQMMLLL